MSKRNSWIAALEPNLGRVLGYIVAGVIVGAFGHGLLDLARLDWLSTGLRAAVGLVLIVAALRLLDRRGRLGFLSRPGAGLWQKLRPLQRHLLPVLPLSIRQFGFAFADRHLVKLRFGRGR